MKKPIVFTFGRFQGPTYGHAKLVEKVVSYAKSIGGEPRIYASKSYDNNKNPIPYKNKVGHLRKLFPNANVQDDPDAHTAFHIAKKLSDEGYTDVTMIVGQDRIEEFKKSIGKYVKPRSDKTFDPKKNYGFDKFNVVSAGERDPDAAGVEGASGTKMREFVRNDDFASFAKNTPTNNARIARGIFNDMKKNLKEEVDIGMTMSRDIMPQLPNIPSFLSFLDKKGIPHKKETLRTYNLKSTQSEFDMDKVQAMMYANDTKPIVVSNDGYVLDGHHRWMANDKLGKDVEGYVIDLPILDLYREAKEFCAQDKPTFGVIQNKLQEEITRKKLAPMLDSFVSFASDKLGLKSMPTIRYKTEDDAYNSFAAYAPGTNELSIYTKNRHPMDIFRSVAHELVHHKQNEDGRLGKDIAKEGSTGSDIENEANAEAGKIMRWFAKKQPDMFKSGYVIESVITEGINDPGKLKAIFLAGGPGSGKDFVMNKTLTGEGLTEINSDVALEFMMKRAGLDLEMPASERIERDTIRGKAKNVTKEKQRLALAGRLGLIINGTADDVDKIAGIKKTLEDMGYETMMVFVNTSNEVSRLRNLERGKSGGRKVPDGTDKEGKPDGSDNLRQEKWDAAQKNIGEFQKLFGQKNTVVIDNSEDIRKVDDKEKAKIETNFNRVRRMVMNFARSENNNPKAAEWEAQEIQKRGITNYQPPRASAPLQQPQQVAAPQSNQGASNDEMEQARRLGLSYFGFGRFGKAIAGQNKVLYKSQDGQLVKVPTAVQEETTNEDLRQWFKQKWVRFDTKGNIKGDCAREPGEGKPKCRPLASARAMSKKARALAAKRKRREDPVADRSGKGGKPIMVATEAKRESVQTAIDKINRDKMINEKNEPTNPALWSKAKSLAKSKFDVYPSAYANGWASKWYKSKGGGWKSVSEEANSCWDGYTRQGMKKKGDRMVPNCVPVSEDQSKVKMSKKGKVKHKLANVDEKFESFMEEVDSPAKREWGTDSLTKTYKDMTPGQDFKGDVTIAEKKKKKLKQEDAPPPYGYEFGNNGVGPTFGVIRSPGGYGMGYSLPMNESIINWMNKASTQQKFIEKYGNLAEQKLIEAACKLEDAGCGCEMASAPKSIRKMRESIKEPAEMGTVPTQRKDEVSENYDKNFAIATRTTKGWRRVPDTQFPNEERAKAYGDKYHMTKDGSRMYKIVPHPERKIDEASAAWQRKAGKNPEGGLNRKGIASYRRENPGSKLSMAVTTPPSKLDPDSKAAKRRKSFCARMGGMRGPMKDEKGRPTRKALSLRKWNCEE